MLRERDKRKTKREMPLSTSFSLAASDFLHISSEYLQYILPGNTTYKKPYPTATIIPFGAKYYVCPRGTSFNGKSVRDFFRIKGFLRICDGFFLKTKGLLPKMYEIFESEMRLASTTKRPLCAYTPRRSQHKRSK